MTRRSAGSVPWLAGQEDSAHPFVAEFQDQQKHDQRYPALGF